MTQKIGFSKERLADGKILVYRFTDIYRATVDAWAADITVEYVSWEHPLLRTMLDLRPAGSIISAYAINAARPLAKLRPELKGRLAIMINNRVAAQIISAAILANLNTRRRRLLFAEEKAAITWLLLNED